MIRVKCPAKINTFLAVGPPDSTGYHPLRTIFQAIDLCDELEIEPATATSISCDWADLPADNTLSKALRLFGEIASVPALAIHLTKRIPAESGLGGGSSDAAGLLRALVQICPGVPMDHVEMIAATVGADVPFFLCGGRARAEAYGEKLTPLPDAPAQVVLIARPASGSGTAGAYRALDQIDRPFADWPADDRTTYNDFERVAAPASLNLINQMHQLGATCAGLSGSGSAVFGYFGNHQEAQNAAEQFGAGVATWVTRTLSRQESLWISSF